MKKMNKTQATILGTSATLFAVSGAISAFGIICGFNVPTVIEVIAGLSGFHSAVFIYNQTK